MGPMIGVFDSGVGGLGILAEIRHLLPEVDLVYVADHAGAPYGPRSLDQVQRRSEYVTRWLLAQGCSIVTIACNTASAAALHGLRRRHPGVGFVGMEPALKPAAVLTTSGRVGIVATAATFQGELFATAVDRFASGVELITAACPSWVALVEAGTLDGPEVRREVEACLQPLRVAEVDVLVLACTHYPMLAPVIAEVMGPGVRIIDPAPAVARQAARLAAARGAEGGGGTIQARSTGDGRPLAAAVRRAGLDAAVSLLPWEADGSS
jgi:glutamate racemase